MTIKLIYHSEQSLSEGFSPFDMAIMEIVKNKDVSIACPYLSVNYLLQIINICSSWRIITDIEEWLGSLKGNSRLQAQEFICSNSKLIHHYKDLHAKVITVGRKAIVGSANFTEKGLAGRIEMSVYFEDSPEIDEINRWFEYLWGASGQIDLNAVAEYIKAVSLEDKLATPQIKNKNQASLKLPSIGPKIKSKISFGNKIKVKTQNSDPFGLHKQVWRFNHNLSTSILEHGEVQLQTSSYLIKTLSQSLFTIKSFLEIYFDCRRKQKPINNYIDLSMTHLTDIHSRVKEIDKLFRWVQRNWERFKSEPRRSSKKPKLKKKYIRSRVILARTFREFKFTDYCINLFCKKINDIQELFEELENKTIESKKLKFNTRKDYEVYKRTHIKNNIKQIYEVSGELPTDLNDFKHITFKVVKACRKYQKGSYLLTNSD